MLPHSRRLLPAILVGGLGGGLIDLLKVCILDTWRSPLGVAAGLLGRSAIHGGPAIYVLGIVLHLFIATAAAAVYCAASIVLPFLLEYPLVCGLSFGAAVELVMDLIVLPNCALHLGAPIGLHQLGTGLLSHMILIGLPISYSARAYLSPAR